MSGVIRVAAGGMLAVLAMACGGSKNTPTAPSTPASPSLSAITLTGYSGTPLNRRDQTVQLTATARYSDGATRDVTATAAWRSDNAAVATVSGSGLVTAVGDGEATVVAELQGVAGTVRLRVDLPKRAAPEVTGSIAVRPSPEPLFLFRAEMSLTYRETSRAVGMNVNFVNVTWRDYRGDLMIFRNYDPGALTQIWGSNHINAGDSRALVARIDYNRPVSSVSVLVETSVQDDFGNVISFSNTFRGGVSLVPPGLSPSLFDFTRPVLFWDEAIGSR